jgi:hypothetical protein
LQALVGAISGARLGIVKRGPFGALLQCNSRGPGSAALAKQ